MCVLDRVGAVIGVAAWILFLVLPLVILTYCLVDTYHDEKRRRVK